MKFKIGQKVKLPKTKSVEGWGSLISSYHWNTAVDNNQDYMYITGFDEDLRCYEVGWRIDYNEGDFYLESDLELYDSE